MGGGWVVVLHDDNVNTVRGVVYVLKEVLGMPAERGLDVAREVDGGGAVEVLRCADREAAESVAAELQLRGVRAMVRVN